MSNLEMLREKTKELRYADRKAFESVLLGALSAAVSAATWEHCLHTAQIAFQAYLPKSESR